MPTLEDCYRLLELPQGAPLEDVKRAFRSLAKEWHPDLYPYDPALRARCERKMRRLNEAYEILRGRAPADEEPAEAPSEPPEEPASEEPVPEEKAYVYEEADPGSDMGPWSGEAPQPPAEAEKPWFRWEREAPPDYPGLLRVGLAFLAAGAAAAYLFFGSGDIDAVTRRVRAVTAFALFYGAWFALRRGYWEFVGVLGILGLIMNPLLPVPMPGWEWRAFNALWPFLLIFTWSEFYRRERRRGPRF